MRYCFEKWNSEQLRNAWYAVVLLWPYKRFKGHGLQRSESCLLLRLLSVFVKNLNWPALHRDIATTLGLTFSHWRINWVRKHQSLLRNAWFLRSLWPYKRLQGHGLQRSESCLPLRLLSVFVKFFNWPSLQKDIATTLGLTFPGLAKTDSGFHGGFWLTEDAFETAEAAA